MTLMRVNRVSFCLMARRGKVAAWLSWKGIKKQILKIQTTAPSMQELSRVKAQVMAASVYEKDSVFYQAMQLGTLETVGLGWQRKDEYLSNIQAVTPQQVQQVAKKYLQNDRLTIATLEPQPMQPAKPSRRAQGGRHGQ